jgi:hypothetical protein
MQLQLRLDPAAQPGHQDSKMVTPTSLRPREREREGER